MNHYVKKTADGESRQPGERNRLNQRGDATMRLSGFESAWCGETQAYIMLPILKIGRYMATTSVPTMPPSTEIIIGSIN